MKPEPGSRRQSSRLFMAVLHDALSGHQMLLSAVIFGGTNQALSQFQKLLRAACSDVMWPPLPCER